MTSSGMKRGLAVTAVSALAVTGLPLFTAVANATPLAEQFTDANAVQLYTADGMTAPGAVSVRNDGVNTTVHLVSSGGSAVAQVRYTYTHGTDAAVEIDTVSRTNGVFSVEWSPATNLLGETVTLTAQALSNAGAEIGTPDTQSVVVSANTTSVDIANAAGSTIGVFQQPYTGHADTLGVVSGTTSDLTGDVTLNGLAVNAANGGEYGEPANNIRSFKGAASFDGYAFDTTDPKVDEARVQAVAGSDDNEAVKVYAQKISSVSAAALNANPPASNPATKAVVTVLDQNGKAIVGAEVVQTGTGASTQYTDVNGQASFDVAGDADGNSFEYVVNVDDEDGYQSGKDFQKTVTVTTYSDTAMAIAANASKLGNALDADEYAANPVSIKVTDGRGAPRNGQAVQYSWMVDKFEPASDAPVAAGSGSVTTGTDGTVNIPAPTGGLEGTYTLNTYIERDGNPGQTGGDVASAPLVVKIGQAELKFSDDMVAQAAAGSSKTFDAKLVLDDGTALSGREVTFSYAPGAEVPAGAGDSFVSATQPAGTTRVNNNSAKDTTNAEGKVSVSLTDPAETTQPKEKGGDLNVATSGTSTAGATNSADSLRVDWLTSMAPVNEDDIWVNTDELIDNIATPGRPVSLDIEVENADGEMLTDFPVQVSVNHGSFTPTANSAAELAADPAAADGGLYGEWKNIGTKQGLVSDDAGLSEATVNIERDAGFDDDGHVQMNVTIRAGSVTKVVPVDFVSGEDGAVEVSSQPLNPGSVVVKRSAEQTVSQDVLPNAPTTEFVNFDVIATDQFGNRVKAYVEISDDSALADLAESVDGSRYDCYYVSKLGGYDCYDYVTDTEFFSPTNLEGSEQLGYAPIDNGDYVESQFTAEEPELRASSNAATTQQISAKWAADQNLWEDGDTITAGFQAARDDKLNEKVVTDTSAPIHWYVIDFDASDYSLKSGDSTRTVGDTVHTQFTAVDQMGEPIENLQVRFFRTGPDDLQDGEGKGAVGTNSDGEALYIWQGAKAGTALVTSVVRTPQGDLIPQAELSSKVTFAKATPARKHISAALSLKNQRDGDDVAKVNAPSAAKGAKVKLYKVRKDGSRKWVATKTANKYGNATFVVNDGRTKRFTKYVALVSKTARTFGDWTAKARIR